MKCTIHCDGNDKLDKLVELLESIEDCKFIEESMCFSYKGLCDIRLDTIGFDAIDHITLGIFNGTRYAIFVDPDKNTTDLTITFQNKNIVSCSHSDICDANYLIELINSWIANPQEPFEYQYCTGRKFNLDESKWCFCCED